MSLGGNLLRQAALGTITSQTGIPTTKSGAINKAASLAKGQIKGKVPAALNPYVDAGINALSDLLRGKIGGTGVVKRSPFPDGGIGDANNAVNNSKFGYWKEGEIPEQYTVLIASRSLGKVRAILQDEVSFQVSSEWGSMIPSKIARGINKENLARVGALFKVNIMSRFASRRVWVSTTPIAMVMKLIFESEDDALNDVVMPCKVLQGMALPGEGFGSIGKLFNKETKRGGFLIPPGPSPYGIDFKAEVAGKNVAFSFGQDERIDIYVGTFLNFGNVIIKSVNVTYDSRMEERGFPISARVDIVFESYEIVTKFGIDDMYINSTPIVPQREKAARRSVKDAEIK